MDAGLFTAAICLLSVPVAVVPAAEQTSRPAVPATGEFLTRAGEQVLLGGKPFRAIGVNKRELLDQYLADLLGRDPRTSRNLAIKTLDGFCVQKWPSVSCPSVNCEASPGSVQCG